jgi:hypothetical protein
MMSRAAAGPGGSPLLTGATAGVSQPGSTGMASAIAAWRGAHQSNRSGREDSARSQRGQDRHRVDWHERPLLSVRVRRSDTAEEAQKPAGRDRRTADRLQDTGARVCIALLHDPSQGPVQTSGVFMSTAAEEWARMSRQAQRYNEIIKAAATKYGAAVIDIPATQIFITPAFMYEDGIILHARL